MSMQTTAVRFVPDEHTWIRSHADSAGRSFSDVTREASLEPAEDAADLQAFNEALAEDDGARYSFEDVVAELGKQ